MVVGKRRLDGLDSLFLVGSEASVGEGVGHVVLDAVHMERMLTRE